MGEHSEEFEGFIKRVETNEAFDYDFQGQYNIDYSQDLVKQLETFEMTETLPWHEPVIEKHQSKVF